MAVLTPQEREELGSLMAERTSNEQRRAELEPTDADQAPGAPRQPGVLAGTRLGEVKNQFFGGAITGLANMADKGMRLLNEASAAVGHSFRLKESELNTLGDLARKTLPQPSEESSGVESFAHTLGQIAPAAILLRRAIPLAPTVGAKEVAASGVAGATAEALTLLPEDKGVLDLAADLGAPVPAWLQTDPNGDPFQQMGRNFVDGLLGGVTTDILLRGAVRGSAALVQRLRGARGVAEAGLEATGDLVDLDVRAVSALDELAEAERGLLDDVGRQLDPDEGAAALPGIEDAGIQDPDEGAAALPGIEDAGIQASADDASLDLAQNAALGDASAPVGNRAAVQARVQAAQQRLEELWDDGLFEGAPREVRRQIAERLPTSSPRRREILEALRDEPEGSDLIEGLLTRRPGTTPPPEVRSAKEVIALQRAIVDQDNLQAQVETLRPVFNENTMNTTEDVHRVIWNLTDSIQEQTGRQGVKPWKVEDAVASEMLTDLDRLAAVGRELNVAAENTAAWMGAARIVTRTLGDNLVKLAERIDGGDGTLREWDEFARKSDLLRDVTASLQGVRTSVARAQGFGRRRTIDDRVLDDALLSSPLGHDDSVALAAGSPSRALQRRLRAVLNAKTPADVNRAASLTRGQILRGMIVQNHIQSLLSGPKTAATNLFNAVTYTKRFYWDMPIGAALAEGSLRNVPRAAVRNFMMQQSLDRDRIALAGRAFFDAMADLGDTNAGPNLRARAHALKQRVSETPTARALRTGQSQIDPTHTLDEPSVTNFFDPEVTGQLLPDDGSFSADSAFGRAFTQFFKYYEGVNGIGTRLLAGSDEFVKQVSVTASINQHAMQEAFRQGITEPAAVKRFVRDFSANQELTDAALQEARRITLTMDPDSELGRALGRGLARFPLMRLIVPIYRAPARVMNEFVRMTPGANLANRNVREALRKVRTGEQLTQADGEEIATMVGGAMLWGMGAALAQGGYIRGAAPVDARKRASFLAGGQGENSIILPSGDAIGFDRAAPYGLILSAMGTYVRLNEELGIDPDPRDQNELLVFGETMFAAMRRAVASQSMFQTFGKLLTAIEDEDPVRIERILLQTAGGHLPLSGAMRQLDIDPVMRELRTLEDVLLASNPITSTDVPARRDPLGNKRERPSGTGPWPASIVSPFAEFEQSDSPALREISRLGMAIDHRRFRVPAGDGNNRLELTGEQSDALYDIFRDIKVGGQTVQQAVDELVQSRVYQERLTDSEGRANRADVIRSTIDSYFKLAKNKHKNSSQEMRDLYDRAELIEVGAPQSVIDRRFPDGINF